MEDAAVNKDPSADHEEGRNNAADEEGEVVEEGQSADEGEIAEDAEKNGNNGRDLEDEPVPASVAQI